MPEEVDVDWGFRPQVDHVPSLRSVIRVGYCAGCGYLTFQPHSVCPMMIRFVTKPHHMVIGGMTIAEILDVQARWN